MSQCIAATFGGRKWTSRGSPSAAEAAAAADAAAAAAAAGSSKEAWLG